MALSEMPLKAAPATTALPADVRRFLREARRRVGRIQRGGQLPAFIVSDFGPVYGALREVEGAGGLAGRWFCEWGSGLGVVSCLAATLGLDAWGIEEKPELVRAARRLAVDFGLPVEFVRGSFIPAGAEDGLTRGREFAWLGHGGTPSAYQAMGFGPEEFDLVFAYPWPDEEALIEGLFEGHAREGAMLLTFHADGALRLRRLSARPDEAPSRAASAS
jgi:hypothetical protein